MSNLGERHGVNAVLAGDLKTDSVGRSWSSR